MKGWLYIMKILWKTIRLVLAHIWHWYEKIIALLGGRTIAMLAVALLITIFSVIVSDQWINSIGEQDAAISKGQQNILTLQTLKTNLHKAESSQRGYLITHRDVYIFPFNQALDDARANIEVIEDTLSQAADVERQAEKLSWLKTISASLEAKASEMKVTVRLSEAGNAKEAKQVMNLDQGIYDMVRIMDYSNKLIKSQTADLDDMIKARKDTISFARLSLLTGALILIVLMVLVIKQLLAEIVIKSELQLRLAKENETYELRAQQQSKLLRSLALDYQADVERERQKLSRELHDELGSIFTATKMDVAWAIKKLKGVEPKDIAQDVENKLRKTSRYIDQGINYQRHIVQELHPAMLSTFGFWEALTSLIEDAAERNQWELTLNLPDKNTQINETIGLVAYRIVQETLNNANKYAKATEVSVHLIADEKYLKLEISDNGIGVDMKALNTNTHGLSGMRHRVLAIGGHFEILSELGEGVLTRALIPLDIQPQS